MTPQEKRKVLSRFTVGDKCWEWTAGKSSKGYGMVYVGGKMQMAYRVVYELYRGAIPEGRQLDHLCRNPGCVNPEHLEPVTSKENTLRGEGIAARNARKTHCIHGHKYTPENTIIRKDGAGKECRTCRHNRAQERRKRTIIEKYGSFKNMLSKRDPSDLILGGYNGGIARGKKGFATWEDDSLSKYTKRRQRDSRGRFLPKDRGETTD